MKIDLQQDKHLIYHNLHIWNWLFYFRHLAQLGCTKPAQTTIDWENGVKLIAQAELWVCSQIRGSSHHVTIEKCAEDLNEGQKSKTKIQLTILACPKFLGIVVCVKMFDSCWCWLCAWWRMPLIALSILWSAQIAMLLPALYSWRKSIAYSQDGIEMDGHGFWVDLCRWISLFSGIFTFLWLELRYLRAKTRELWGWG